MAAVCARRASANGRMASANAVSVPASVFAVTGAFAVTAVSAVVPGPCPLPAPDSVLCLRELQPHSVLSLREPDSVPACLSASARKACSSIR
eukprot:2847259-Rhodomonas_salina.3